MPGGAEGKKSGRVNLFALLCAVIAILLPFIRIRPNRIVQGKTYSIWYVTDVGSIIPYLLPILYLIVREVLKTIKFNRSINITGIILHEQHKISITVDPIILFLMGVYGIGFHFFLFNRISGILLEPFVPFGRASMGFGSWIWLFFCYILLSTSWKDINSRKIKTILTFVFLVVLFALGWSGSFSTLGITIELSGKLDKFIFEFKNHLKLSFTAVLVACVVGIPAGIVSYRKRILEKPIFFFVNTVQTLPSLALFGLLIAPLAALSRSFPILRNLGIKGIGTWPALIALSLYALLPITRNTYTGLNIIPESVKESAFGMGMRRGQVFLQVEVPIALPVVLNGVRISAVQAVGNTAVAALIGAGGFGVFLFQGLGQGASDMILLGAFPIIVLALFVDNVMELLIRVLVGRWYRVS